MNLYIIEYINHDFIKKEIEEDKVELISSCNNWGLFLINNKNSCLYLNGKGIDELISYYKMYKDFIKNSYHINISYELSINYRKSLRNNKINNLIK